MPFSMYVPSGMSAIKYPGNLFKFNGRGNVASVANVFSVAVILTVEHGIVQRYLRGATSRTCGRNKSNSRRLQWRFESSL